MAAVERRTQYKRNPRLQEEFWAHYESWLEQRRHCQAWKDVLQSNPPEDVLDTVAYTLARLGFQPDERGMPIGELPPVPPINPLAILDSIGSSSYQRPEGSVDVRDTLEWKANILEAATLIWAEAEKAEGIPEVYPILPPEPMWVREILLYSDLEKFWLRPGVGLTAGDIRKKWDRGDRIVTKESLGDMLRKAKGWHCQADKCQP